MFRSFFLPSKTSHIVYCCCRGCLLISGFALSTIGNKYTHQKYTLSSSLIYTKRRRNNDSIEMPSRIREHTSYATPYCMLGVGGFCGVALSINKQFYECRMQQTNTCTQSRQTVTQYCGLCLAGKGREVGWIDLIFSDGNA